MLIEISDVAAFVEPAGLVPGRLVELTPHD